MRLDHDWLLNPGLSPLNLSVLKVFFYAVDNVSIIRDYGFTSVSNGTFFPRVDWRGEEKDRSPALVRIEPVFTQWLLTDLQEWLKWESS